MGCKKSCGGCIISAIIALILAILAGVFYSSAVVTGIAALLYTIIGFSAFFLIALIVISLFGRKREEYCVCKNGTCVLIGSLGAIIASALTIALTVSATATAVLIGIVTFFIVLAIIEFFSLIQCLVKANCVCND